MKKPNKGADRDGIVVWGRKDINDEDGAAAQYQIFVGAAGCECGECIPEVTREPESLESLDRWITASALC